jgi:hypothetical protein
VLFGFAISGVGETGAGKLSELIEFEKTMATVSLGATVARKSVNEALLGLYS